jgi:hypothetical protein
LSSLASFRVLSGALIAYWLLAVPVGLSLTAQGHDGAEGARPPGTDEPLSVTLPFTLDHNRMIVDVEFVRSDGTVRPARAWVDTGNEVLILSKPLAHDLGIDVSGVKDKGLQVELPAPAPLLRFGGLLVRTEGVKTEVLPSDSVWQGLPADFNLPVSLLRNEHLVFDYPARSFTIARPGVLKPEGVAIPCRVNAETGLFMVTAVIDADTVQMGVDNGSAGTWVSDSLTKAWTTRHPAWPRATGAAGSANFFGFPFESEGVLMRLPELKIGPVRAQDVALLGLDQSFFNWYSGKSAGSVLGFIGSNVLRNFRLEVDLPNQMTYWTAGPPDKLNDLDIVGLTLRPEADGSFTVVGVVSEGGRPTVDGVQPGDRLIRVDGLEVTGATMGAVVDALRGRPGSKHTVVLERAGRRFTVKAEVKRLP